MTAISLSTGTFSNDPLRVEGLDAGEDGGAVRTDVLNVDVNGLVLVEHLDVVINREKPEDEGKSNTQGADDQQLAPGQPHGRQDARQ